MTLGMATLLSMEYLPHVRYVKRGTTATPKKDAEILIANGLNYISGKDHGTADNSVWLLDRD